MKNGTRYGWLVLLVALTAVALGDANGEQFPKYLEQSVDWYHRVLAIDPTPVNAQEFLFRQTVRDQARLAIGKGFEFARAENAALHRSQKSSTTQRFTGRAVQLPQMMADTDAQILSLQGRVDAASTVANNARAADIVAARARLQKLQAQLDLANAQSSVLHNYADFLASGGNGTESFSDRIDDLQRSVPETDLTATTRPAEDTVPTTVHEADGLLSLVSELFALTNRMRDLTTLADEADELMKTSDKLHEPVRTQIMDAMRRGNAFGASTQPTTTVSGLDAERDQIESITTTIKGMSDVGLALSQQRIYLEDVQKVLINWRAALAKQYTADIRSLVIRVIVTVVIFLLIVTFSELWRRATYRYVHDTRRRRQLMLVRRIVVGFIVVLIIIASVMTELGSLATFAGLITAGIAVSLQTVILSGVAYFFFIGRFGVRVGDRVTISGITGDVVEVGLFRLYLLELSGQKGDLHSTGRMIVFSNAVLFQPSAFYKQMPGTEYVWHEVAMTLTPDGDHLLAEKRLMSAVQSIFAEYKASIDAQHERAMQTLHVTLDRPQPEGRLRFVDAGVEFVIRYPVELDRASLIDDQMTRKLLDTINEEPKLKFAASATPRIQVS